MNYAISTLTEAPPVGKHNAFDGFPLIYFYTPWREREITDQSYWKFILIENSSYLGLVVQTCNSSVVVWVGMATIGSCAWMPGPQLGEMYGKD